MDAASDSSKDCKCVMRMQPVSTLHSRGLCWRPGRALGQLGPGARARIQRAPQAERAFSVRLGGTAAALCPWSWLGRWTSPKLGKRLAPSSGFTTWCCHGLDYQILSTGLRALTSRG